MGLGKKIINFIFSIKFLINLILIGLSYLLVVFIVKTYLNTYTNHGEKIAVPNIIGKNKNEAQKLITDLGLTYAISEIKYDPTKPEGTVLSQDPIPSSKSKVFVKSGRKVRFKISNKNRLVEVPICIDKSERFAQAILENRGFKYRIEYKPSIEAAGAVIEQLYRGKPVKEHQKIQIGSTITLIVGEASGGNFPLPDFTGSTICDVKSRLALEPNMNLIVICENCASRADTCAATVYAQSPEFLEGRKLPGGSTITIHARK